MDDSVFNNLPLLLAVPRAAEILGISRAAAYRLVASGELRCAGWVVASTS
jgi:predicted DNA-binding transcriptional regulator AlpA